MEKVEHLPWNAVAWSFPAATRALVDRHSEKAYPGVLLLLERAVEEE